MDAVRAGLKDGAIQIAPNGDVEIGRQGLASIEMRSLFVPPPVPASAPPSAPGAIPKASSLVTVAVVSPAGPPGSTESFSQAQRTTLPPPNVLQRRASFISYNLGTTRAR